MFSLESQILIVDDMLTMRKSIENTFRELGFNNLHEAADGNEAWTILDKNDPKIDIVVSDWNMPEMTGLELVEQMRADPRFAHLPFIMLTSEAEREQIVRAVQAGISQYLVKPLDSASLRAKLEQVYLLTREAS